MSTINTDLKFVKTVSSGGESISIDADAKRAEERYTDSRDLTKIANRQVRKTFGAIMGARP